MRYKAIGISLALACCLVLAVAAQTPSTGTKGQGKEVSLTGCLQSGTEANTFILKNIGEQAAAGTERPAELAKAETEYRLIADANVNLKEHVGHKVEVTGTISGSRQERTGGSETHRMSNLKVKSLKQVSETCP